MTGEEGTGNREQGTGEEVTGATPRGQVTGKREEGRGKRFWVILLFVTYVGFFRSLT